MNTKWIFLWLWSSHEIRYTTMWKNYEITNRITNSLLWKLALSVMASFRGLFSGKKRLWQVSSVSLKSTLHDLYISSWLPVDPDILYVKAIKNMAGSMVKFCHIWLTLVTIRDDEGLRRIGSVSCRVGILTIAHSVTFIPNPRKAVPQWRLFTVYTQFELDWLFKVELIVERHLSLLVRLISIVW